MDPGDDDPRTEGRREWANWAAHGYRKEYQPRSVLRIGLVWGVLLAALLLAVFWFAFHRGLPG